jgi:hypothetical protein
VKIDERAGVVGDAVRVDPFINEVYEAAILPDKWQGVLDGLAEMADAEGTLLFAAGPGVPRWISSNAIQATITEWTRSKWYLDNPRKPAWRDNKMKNPTTRLFIVVGPAYVDLTHMGEYKWFAIC